MIFKNEETNIQVAVVNYLRSKYPEVLFTIAPNGIKLPIYVAKMLKAMGYRAGTPDILIFEPKFVKTIMNGDICINGYVIHGLFIELKREEGSLQPSQHEFIQALNARGYSARICYGYNKAIEVIDEYFKV